MRIRTILSLFALACLAALSTSACGYAYYAARSQPQTASNAIEQADQFKVYPISVAAVDYQALGYDSEQQWRQEVAFLEKSWGEVFPELLEEEELEKKVTLIGADTAVADGITVRVAVERIQLNWNAFSNTPDQLWVQIVFQDAASGQTLYQGQVEVNNRSGNPYAQSYGMTMETRMYNAARNIAWAVVKIMQNGRLEPPEY